MKASDVQELQLKLQRLQLELKRNRNGESSEEVTEENIVYEERVHIERESEKDDLKISDFEISTTLGKISNQAIINSLRNWYFWKS